MLVPRDTNGADAASQKTWWRVVIPLVFLVLYRSCSPHFFVFALSLSSWAEHDAIQALRRATTAAWPWLCAIARGFRSLQPRSDVSAPLFSSIATVAAWPFSTGVENCQFNWV